MGTIKQGILGGFSGTVGTVVGANWKGVDYMRSRPTRRKASNTQAQLEQRAKFLLTQRFARSMKPLLETGFRSQAVKMTK